MKLAFRRSGYRNADIKRMCEGDLLKRLLPFVRGQAKIRVAHLINLDAAPFVPEGWEVEEHIKGGQFKWDPAKVIPYLSPDQEAGRGIRGDNLRKHLKGQLVLNANVLDYLLAHPDLIPEEWKRKYVFFWGTIYRSSDGDLYVRYLCWSGRWWGWNYLWLDDDWLDSRPAAVLAS